MVTNKKLAQEERVSSRLCFPQTRMFAPYDHVNIHIIASKQLKSHWSREKPLASSNNCKYNKQMKIQWNNNHKVYEKQPLFFLWLAKCLMSEVGSVIHAMRLNTK